MIWLTVIWEHTVQLAGKLLTSINLRQMELNLPSFMSHMPFALPQERHY
jgi:hypothetical protein